MTTETLSPLQHWMRLATVEQQAELAARAGTSREYLYQIGSGYRDCSADLAGRIARAAQAIAESAPGNGHLLPVLTRPALSKTCRDCEYARQCVGDLATATAFPIEGHVPGRARPAVVAQHEVDHDAAADDNT